MFSNVLVANRGEIACRIIRTAHRMGLRAIAVFSEADRDSLHVAEADESHFIGPPEARLSYLNGSRILDVAVAAGAEAIHPGYGFLSENAEFAEACKGRGIAFVGPQPHAIRSMGLKDKAKEIAERAGVPTIPGYRGEDQSADGLLHHAKRIGYPVIIKAIAGGGGRGMRIVADAAHFPAALEACRREAGAAFGDETVLLEKYFPSARHVEVQLIGDSFGNIVHLYERDCSIQRRHQKIIEEAPAYGIADVIRAKMHEAAVAVARSVDYQNAGTVEFLYEEGSGKFYFMEMNTRLQVEHPVSEMITGLDLVELQLNVAAGRRLPVAQTQIQPRGHAIEARLYAEDPAREFLPQSGMVHKLVWPAAREKCRIDTGIAEGSRIGRSYDAMIAKIIGWGQTRAEAIDELRRAVGETFLFGLTTNKGFLLSILASPDFGEKAPDTRFLDGRILGDLPGAARALACASWLFAVAERKGGPWSANSGWTLAGGKRRERHRVLLQGRPIDFTMDYSGRTPILIFDDERHAVEVLGLESQRLRLSIEGKPHELRFHRAASQLFIDVGGHHLSLAEPSYDQASGETQGQGAVRAPMPGRVLKLEVAAGKIVRAGESLLVLEAMKMEHILRAPVAGRLANIAVAEGQQVAEGDLLCTIGPESG
jgi:3-methylcrotonyl-CoA carboxylase alpha subunit